MKKALAFLLALAMTTGLLTGCGSDTKSNSSGGSATGSQGDGSEVYKIKYECVLNEASYWYQMGVKMAEMLEERTDGRIIMECYANAQLAGGNQQKGLENVINNVVQVDCRSSMLWQVMDDKLGVWAIPFFYDSTDVILNDLEFSEAGEAYAETLEGLGLKLMGLVEYGPRPIATNKPLTCFEDIKDMKIRVASVPLHLDGLAAVGANPMAMNWSEMYTGLQQGTVDGMEAPYQVMIDNTVYDVCKYYYDCSWVMDPGVVTVNAEFYNSLPEDLRTIFDEVFDECRAWEIEEFQKANETAKERLVSEFGCTINPMSDADLQKFEEAMQPVHKAYEESVGADYLDLFRR
ncbi:MAG: TRAP transporter substrate-binding protein [Lawsonibacter sp.]|jgi:TRAP-type C4-dicarboxylate transport system substrate-binding protein